MVNIIKQEIVIEESLKKKLELICDFSNLENNKKLQEENEHLKRINYQSEYMYNRLKEKNDYLIYHLNKIMNRLPEFIQNVINKLFNYNNIDLKYFKQLYIPEVKRKKMNLNLKEFLIYSIKKKSINL